MAELLPEVNTLTTSSFRRDGEKKMLDTNKVLNGGWGNRRLISSLSSPVKHSSTNRQRKNPPSTPSTTSPSTPMTQKAVRFDTDMTVEHTIPGLGNMDKEEVWYTRSDYISMREEIGDTLKLISAGLSDPERAGLCYRGIEAKTDGSRRIKSRIIESSLRTVLEAQDITMKNSLEASSTGWEVSSEEINEEKALIIAKLYKECTIRSELDARRMGQYDERCVLHYRYEDKSPTMPRRKWAKAG